MYVFVAFYHCENSFLVNTRYSMGVIASLLYHVSMRKKSRTASCILMVDEFLSEIKISLFHETIYR